jgi:hypothetical protein
VPLPRGKTHPLTTALDSDACKIRGLDVRIVTPCRCGCALIRIHPYSVKSSIPVWKCSWCARRKGKLAETEIKLLKRWVHQFDWTLEPLVFHEDGKVYASCQLPALWEATSGVRRENSLVPALPPGDTVFDGDALSRGSEALWPDAEVTLRSKRVLSLIEQHDEWLKDRGWYDIITATMDNNWTGEDDRHIYDTE